ncbi:MAG: hypothetical protein OEM82_06940 [Acidobacteriota bacterium]|nr:hypothetical protein [Acidobacteriota bacterium]MDH3528607.1 hypothetical protein [Acidobacteriota bacterium]
MEGLVGGVKEPAKIIKPACRGAVPDKRLESRVTILLTQKCLEIDCVFRKCAGKADLRVLELGCMKQVFVSLAAIFGKRIGPGCGLKRC